MAVLSYLVEPLVYDAHKQSGVDECYGISCFRTTHVVCAVVSSGALCCTHGLHVAMRRASAARRADEKTRNLEENCLSPVTPIPLHV